MSMMMNVFKGFLREPKKLARGFLRGKMTPKMGNKNFYKGYGARSVGRHTRKGGYVVDLGKLPAIVAPDLTNCELKPYVAHNTPKIKVPPPTLPHLDLNQSELPVEWIVNDYPNYKLKTELNKLEKKQAKESNTSTTSPNA